MYQLTRSLIRVKSIIQKVVVKMAVRPRLHVHGNTGSGAQHLAAGASLTRMMGD